MKVAKGKAKPVGKILQIIGDTLRAIKTQIRTTKNINNLIINIFITQPSIQSVTEFLYKSSNKLATLQLIKIIYNYVVV